MAAPKVPTTVSDLLAKVAESTGNIAKHRAAMAKVAALAKANTPIQPQTGGEK